MTEAIKRRKGTTAEHTTFIGLEAEMTVDTTKDTAIIHDGITPGGIPLAREDLSNVQEFGLGRKGVVPGLQAGQDYAYLTGQGWTSEPLIGTSTVSPTPEDGIEGSFWINTTLWKIYGPKTDGAWPAGVSIVGPKGDTGDTGPQGNTILYAARAPISSDGLDGNFWINTSTLFIYGPKSSGSWPAGTSIVGPKGDTGDQGPKGDKGEPGRSLQLGTVAPTTSDGVEGDTYIDTAAWKIYGPKTSGVWGTGYDLHGAKGDTGQSGNSVLSGGSDPNASIGINGDFYLNLNSKYLFGPKANGVWPAGFSIVGPTGATGPTGTGLPSGGTAGQILYKNSSTNYDYTWVSKEATTADVIQGSATKYVLASSLFQAGVPVNLTVSSATVTPDFNTGINFTCTLNTASIAMANPTNMKVGQTGIIILKQDSGGNKAITSWGSAYKFFGGVYPVLSIVPLTIDAISYLVIDSSTMLCTFLQGAY